MTQTDNKVVVITGARGQVGSALTRRLQSRMPLALLDRAQSERQGVEPMSKVATFGGVDLADESSVQKAVARVRAEFGAIRALVHTVGGYADGAKVHEQPLETVRRMLDLNYLSAVHVVKAVLPDVIAAGNGRIVLFASADALRGRAGASAYAAAKAALLRFAEALADEVAPHGVCVHVVVPTTIDSPNNRAAMPAARFADWVTPEEIASCVEFLLSSAASGLRFATLPMGR